MLAGQKVSLQIANTFIQRAEIIKFYKDKVLVKTDTAEFYTNKSCIIEQKEQVGQISLF